uniref:Uncharacterized protein n=1 Tax=Trichobilharzia regenti TaxID=157069 RepID=A0AA85JUF7_TRIRE|nr:unnamed protein product [Trichobilharzia regenti]
MSNTKLQNFMPDRPWPGLTTTALPAAVSQGGSDKSATEAHKTRRTNKSRPRVTGLKQLSPGLCGHATNFHGVGSREVTIALTIQNAHKTSLILTYLCLHLHLYHLAFLPLMQLLDLIALHFLSTLRPLKTMEAKKPPSTAS